MDKQDLASQPASLGSTAMEVWRAWRTQPYQIGNPCYATAVDHSIEGELTWQNDGIYRVSRTDARQATRLTNSEEDKVWDAIVAGQLRIYRRQRASADAGAAGSMTVLHEATGTGIPEGL